MANSNDQIPLGEAMAEILGENPRLGQNLMQGATNKLGDGYRKVVFRVIGLNVIAISIAMTAKYFGSSSVAILFALAAAIFGLVFFFKPKFLIGVPVIGALLGIPLEGKFEEWADKSFDLYRLLAGTTVGTFVLIYTIIAILPVQWSIPGTMVIMTGALGYLAFALGTKEQEIEKYINASKKFFLFTIAVGVFLIATQNGLVFEPLGLNTRPLALSQVDKKMRDIRILEETIEDERQMARAEEIERMLEKMRRGELTAKDKERLPQLMEDLESLRKQRSFVERGKKVVNIPFAKDNPAYGIALVIALVVLAIVHVIFFNRIFFPKAEAASAESKDEGKKEGGAAKKAEATAGGALASSTFAVALFFAVVIGSVWGVSALNVPYIYGIIALAITFWIAHKANEKSASDTASALKWGSMVGMISLLLFPFVLGKGYPGYWHYVLDRPDDHRVVYTPVGRSLSTSEGFKYFTFVEETNNPGLVPINLANASKPLCRASDDCKSFIDQESTSRTTATHILLPLVRHNAQGNLESFNVLVYGGSCDMKASKDGKQYKVCESLTDNTGHVINGSTWTAAIGNGASVSGKWRASFLTKGDIRIELFVGEGDMGAGNLWATVMVRLRDDLRKQWKDE